VCLAHAGLAWGYFRGFSRDSATFTDEILPSHPARETLAGFIVANDYRGYPLYIQFADYYIAWKQGVATTRLIDAPSFPLRRKADKVTLPVYNEWVDWWISSDEYRDGYFDTMDFILVKGEIPDKAAGLFKHFAVDRKSGDWTLYRRMDRGSANRP
jgi:hypothetical protein